MAGGMEAASANLAILVDEKNSCQMSMYPLVRVCRHFGPVTVAKIWDRLVDWIPIHRPTAADYHATYSQMEKHGKEKFAGGARPIATWVLYLVLKKESEYDRE